LAHRFPGFSPAGIEFLRELKKNNDREWFTPRKAIYERELRLPMIELVRAIHGEMLSFAPNYVGEPAKCVFRVYRDTRFAKDKTPYRTHIAAVFFRNGLLKQGPGYYFVVSPESIDVEGGIYDPEPDALLAVRRLIADNFDEFRKTFEPAKIAKLVGGIHGASITRPPKGFDPGHPSIEHLKRKSHHFIVRLEPELATTPKLLPELVKRFRAMTPLVEFLERPFVPDTKRRL
jgi:uncharacterized protein (TIGR02453 family)